MSSSSSSSSFCLLCLSLSFSFVILTFTIISVKRWWTRKPPVAGTVFHLLFYFDTLFDYLLHAARRHRTFRLLLPSSQSYVYTADPAVVEHILLTSFGKYNKGKYHSNIMYDLFGNGIFAVDGERWRQQRKVASYEFSTKVLRDFSTVVFRSNALKLAAKISDAAKLSILFNMQDLLMKSSLDSIFKVAVGVELETLSGTNDLGVRFSEAFDEANRIIYHRYVDVFWELKRYLNVGLEYKLKKHIRVIDDFVLDLIKHKRNLMKSGIQRSKEDILSRFIMESEKNPEEMNDKYLRDIILNFLLAGKDTTANTLTWFFYMLCKHPHVQEKIADEVNEAMKTTVAFRDSDSTLNIVDFAASLTDAALDKMQYLHATLTETLRLFPAVPVDGKIAGEDDVWPDGSTVKKGDSVSYMAYAMGRMIDIWGSDAENFRPERWLENGKFMLQSPFKFTAFHAGPRICLGKEFAYRQMKIVAALLLHHFIFKLGDESFIPGYRTMFTLHMDKGLHLLVISRSY